MNIENIEKILKGELAKTSKQLDNNQKFNLYTNIKNELVKYLDYEDTKTFPEDIQVKIFGNVIRFSLFEGAKIFSTKISSEYHPFIFEVLVETLFQATYACFEGGFEKDERVRIIKEEARLGISTAISVLCDRETISENIYTEALALINQ